MQLAHDDDDDDDDDDDGYTGLWIAISDMVCVRNGLRRGTFWNF